MLKSPSSEARISLPAICPDGNTIGGCASIEVPCTFIAQKKRFIKRSLIAAAVVSMLFLTGISALCEEQPEDHKLFVSGFDAYQQKNYSVSLQKLKELLAKYPDSPLRDLALFWLSRSYYRTGNLAEAARYKAQFSREYPDSLLNGMLDNGEPQDVGRPPASSKKP